MSSLQSSRSSGEALGLVGAGRTRNGLGPFLASFAERAGLRVAGVAGRSPERAAANAADLEARLGHRVMAHPDLEALCASGIDALLIASPVEHHLEALKAALARRLPVLCEKPLVHEAQAAAGAALIEEFAATGLPLMENCQWPFVLPALCGRRPRSGRSARSRIALGLAPARPGREMVTSVLSHLLSVVQALRPVDAQTRVAEATLERCAANGAAATLCIGLETPAGSVEAILELRVCSAPPRPAWIAVDGLRWDRRVTAGHGFVFESSAGTVGVADPTQLLLQRFAQLVREGPSDEVLAEIDAVRQRWRLYGEILRALPPLPGGSCDR